MIELTDWLKAELVRRAEQEAPQEAVGLISRATKPDARGKRPITLWATENVAQEPETTFLVDPKAQTRILNEIWKQKQDWVGIYHSHPRGLATPSETDLMIARGHLLSLTWVIVGRRPCRCLPMPVMGGPGDNDLIPDGDCEICEDSGYVPDFFAGELS